MELYMLRMMMHMLVRKYALKSYFLILVGTSIFMDKSATYVDVVYLKFFMGLEQIHEYNWGETCLVYL